MSEELPYGSPMLKLRARIFKDSPQLARAPSTQIRLKPPPGLGDHLKNFLAAHGVTEETVADAFVMVGLPPTCGGCEKRQQWLNKFGEKTGLSKLTNEFFEWYEEKRKTPRSN